MNSRAPTSTQQTGDGADPAAMALLILARWLAAELHRVDPAHARALANPHTEEEIPR